LRSQRQTLNQFLSRSQRIAAAQANYGPQVFSRLQAIGTKEQKVVEVDEILPAAAAHPVIDGALAQYKKKHGRGSSH